MVSLSPAFVFQKAKLSIGLIILVVQAFLWINADFIYGPFAEPVRNILLIYFVFFFIVVSRMPASLRMPTFGQKESGINFVIAFILTSVVLIAIPFIWIQMASIEIAVLAIGFGLLHSFVKAYIEEIVFRWALPFAWGLGDIISNILFGLFHMSVAIAAGVEFSLFTIGLLMGIGYIFSLVRRRFGIMGATGAHTAYNMAALGLLPSIFGIAT